MPRKGVTKDGKNVSYKHTVSSNGVFFFFFEWQGQLTAFFFFFLHAMANKLKECEELLSQESQR